MASVQEHIVENGLMSEATPCKQICFLLLNPLVLSLVELFNLPKQTGYDDAILLQVVLHLRELLGKGVH